MVLPAELNYDDFITDLLDCGYWFNENDELISEEGLYDDEEELFDMWKKNGGKF
jgi:hypothetical protein